MRKQKFTKTFYNYTCTMTAEEFKLTAKAPSPDDLVCVKAYYELNPDKDDRPEVVKKHEKANAPIAPIAPKI
jgi:hypothetical protein